MYEKNTWTTGDIITAEKLNNIEDGISNNNALIIQSQIDDIGGIETLDKTFSEIYEATNSGKKVIFKRMYSDGQSTEFGIDTLQGALYREDTNEGSSTYSAEVAFMHYGSFSASSEVSLEDLFSKYPYMSF